MSDLKRKLFSNKKRLMGVSLFLGISLVSGISYFIYTNFIKEKDSEKSKISINSEVVNLNMVDSFGTKSDLYASTATNDIVVQQGQEALLKGNDHLNINANEKSGNINRIQVNTNNNTEDNESENLSKRMKSELAKPADMNEPVVIGYTSNNNIITGGIVTHKKKSSKKESINNNSDENDGRSSDFNSFSFTKNVLPSNSNNLDKSPRTSLTNTENNTSNPSDYVEPINCPAYVLQKTKINGNTTLVVELTESMILPNGKTVEKGTRVAGIANINDTRISLNIQTINLHGKIENVHLAAYDIDGMEGLMVKSARTQSGTSSTINGTLNAASSIGEGALGLPGQLAGGIFRSLLGTGRGGSVAVPAGYKLILKMNY